MLQRTSNLSPCVETLRRYFFMGYLACAESSLTRVTSILFVQTVRARDKGSVRRASHFSWTEGAVLQGIYYEVLAVAAVQKTREEEALRFQANRFSRGK